MVGLYFRLIIWEICVELGIVDILVLLISGLILLFLFNIKLNIFMKIIFEVVVMMNDNVFSVKIKIELMVRNFEVCVEVFIVNFNKMVMVLISGLWVVFVKWWVILFFFNKLLKKSIFNRGRFDGIRK